MEKLAREINPLNDDSLSDGDVRLIRGLINYGSLAAAARGTAGCPSVTRGASYVRLFVEPVSTTDTLSSPGPF